MSSGVANRTGLVDSLPNLFTEMSPQRAEQAYRVYLSRLSMNKRYERIAWACRRIRAYASCCAHRRAVLFTQLFENEALCGLADYSAAWRQLRRWERVEIGRTIDLRASRWSRKELRWFLYYHPAILYFLGRYALARRLAEAVLACELSRSMPGASYEILFHVYKPIGAPSHTYDVTLDHIYRKLGKSLREWKDWERFVEGFHPKVFEIAEITRAALRQDPMLIHPFFLRIRAERKQRLVAGVTFGERDVIETEDRVSRRQQKVIHEIDAFEERTLAARQGFERMLTDWFPELAELAPPAPFLYR